MSAGWLADHQWIISPCLLWAIWCAPPIRAGSDGGGWPRGKAEPRPSLPGSPPITSQQVQCLVDSWEHMTHMKSLIDLRHSIRLLGSSESPPLPSLSLFVTFNLIFFHHLLFIFLPRFVSSKMKVIPKISTRWNRGKGEFFFFFTVLLFSSASSLYESQRQLMWPNLATTWRLQCQPYSRSCWWNAGLWQSISISAW